MSGARIDMASLARFEQAPSERVVKRSANEAAVSMVGENLCPFPANRTRDDAQFLASLIEESERVARRVYGGAHPLASGIEHALRNARAALRARETPPSQNNDSL